MTVLWRSLQYVPAHVEKYVANPRIREADAVILDLEDSVPAAEKVRAREGLSAAISSLSADGLDVLIRINDGALGEADLASAVVTSVAALVIPKVRSAEQVRTLDRLVTDLEAAKGLEAGRLAFVVLIETADGFLDMAAICRASPRVVAINLGAEDFALDVGMACSAETLLGPRQWMAITAVATGVMPLGLVGPATRFDDLEGYRALALRSRRFGYVGSTCIHPSQIAILNAAFSPSPEAVTWAERLVAAAKGAEADGRGAFAIDGQMIDAPIVARAEALLRLQARIRDGGEPNPVGG